MKRILLGLFLAAVAAPLLLFVSQASAAHLLTINIVPPELVFQDVLPGGYAEALVIIDHEQTTPYKLDFSTAGEIESWLGIDTGSATTTPHRKVSLRVTVRPPLKTKPDVYLGYLMISSQEPDNLITTALPSSVFVKIKVFVSDKISQLLDVGKARIVPRSSDSVELLLPVKNSGNVEAYIHARAEVLDENKSSLLLTEKIQRTVLPTVAEDISVPLNTSSLKLGAYWIRVKTFMKEHNEDLETFFREVEREEDLVNKQFLSFSFDASSGAKVLLRELQVESSTKEHSALPLTALVENKAEAKTEAKVVVEVLSENGTVISRQESAPVVLGAKEAKEISFDIASPAAGRHSITGYVVYGTEKTEPISKIVEISSSLSWSLYDVILASGFMAVFILAFVFVRRRAQNQQTV